MAANIIPVIPPRYGLSTPFDCYNFSKNFGLGNTKEQVKYLQFFLQREGFNINTAEYGKFGVFTRAALLLFQELHRSEFPKNYKPSQAMDAPTRTIVNKLFNCQKPAKLPTQNLNLAVDNIILNKTNIIARFCNKGKTDVSSFPVRIILNGINRDFNILSAKKAGSCYTHNFNYATWGLEYSSQLTYNVIVLIDPHGAFKNAFLEYPFTSSSTVPFYVRALRGSHLVIRNISLQKLGLQGTFCNLGTETLKRFPVRIVLNKKINEFDLPELNNPWTCKSKLWSYSTLGLKNVNFSTTTINASVIIDPDDLTQSGFKNVAAINGAYWTIFYIKVTLF